MRISSKIIPVSLMLALQFALMLPFVPLAAAEERAESNLDIQENQQIELEAQELKADLATVEEKSNAVRITLANGKVFEIPAPNESELLEFRALGAEKKEEFFRRRNNFLTSIAQVLQSTKFAYGTGSLIGSNISFVKTSFKKALGKDIPIMPSESVSFVERSERAVLGILASVDKQLWLQAPLLVNANEFGVTAAVSLIAVAGVRGKGFGGVQEFGVSFTVNKEKKAFVFEVYHTSEKFQSSMATVGILAGIVKVGGIMNHRQEGKPGLDFHGKSYGPPVVPGFITVASDSFNAGPMLTVGLPTSPIADMMAYTNSFERNTLIRISVSPLVRGFVRVEIGNLGRATRLLVAPFEAIYVALRNKIVGARAPVSIASCGRAFSS